MTMPWWVRRPDLDEQVRSIMGNSELTVYLDEPHSCLHIMQSDYEFTSIMYPLNDYLRNELRQQAYILHNGQVDDEIRRVREINEKAGKDSENVTADAKEDWREEAVFDYKNTFIGPQNKPTIIVPGEQI